jgi:hypothetical protein
MLNEACGIASLLKCYLNQSGKSRRRLRWVLPLTETQRHRGRYRAGTQKEMCQCENVANAQVQYPIRATTLIIGNTFTLAHFHIPRSPINATGLWPDAKAASKPMWLRRRRGGYATIAFAASPFAPREDRLWRRAWPVVATSMRAYPLRVAKRLALSAAAGSESNPSP